MLSINVIMIIPVMENMSLVHLIDNQFLIDISIFGYMC